MQMRALFNYFTPKNLNGYLEDLIVKYFIFQVIGGLILLLIVISLNLVSHNQNYLVSSVSEFFLFVFLVASLFLLKYKGVSFAGNTFYFVMVGIILVAMNTLNANVSVLFKYLHGFYTVIAFLVGGAIFATRPVIILNAILILISTTRIYFYALKTSPDQSEYFTSGYIYHTVSVLIITVVLFFIKKFHEQTTKKMNSETKIIEDQNAKLFVRESMLSEMNKTKDKFLSIIAHDLKSPMASILGVFTLFTDKFDDYSADEKKKLIIQLKQSTQNAYDLLDNLLMWENSQHGKIDIKPQKENLYLIVEETLKIAHQLANDKSISLTNKIDENIFVTVDRNLILTVFRNILLNAIKFTPKMGSITIRVDWDFRENNFVKVIVKDSGVGITYENQKHLFSITDTISTKGTDGESGTGLGLSISKEFITKHGGEIWVESEKGKGSEFIFTLPK